MDTCQCEDFHWTCSPNEEVTGPARWLTNTTDVLFDLGDFNINEWVLQTHHDFIRTRFGGWSSAFQHNGEGKVINTVAQVSIVSCCLPVLPAFPVLSATAVSPGPHSYIIQRLLNTWTSQLDLGCTTGCLERVVSVHNFGAL